LFTERQGGEKGQGENFMFLIVSWHKICILNFGGRNRMQTSIDTTLQEQIAEALKRAKDKKVLYLYDDAGYKRLLGVFDKKKASRIKRKLKNQRLINRVTEFDIRTTEPDSHWG